MPIHKESGDEPDSSLKHDPRDITVSTARSRNPQTQEAVAKVVDSLTFGDVVAVSYKIDRAEFLVSVCGKIEGGGIRGWKCGFYSKGGVRKFLAEHIKEIEVVARGGSLASSIISRSVAEHRETLEKLGKIRAKGQEVKNMADHLLRD